MKFNEDSRVNIPSILHLMRLGYQYLSPKGESWNLDTNIFRELFKTANSKINPGIEEAEAGRLLEDVKLLLDNEDLGKFICDKKWKNYFYLYFLRPESRARLEKIATGSSQKNLSSIDAVNFWHVYPSEELLNKFNEVTKYFIGQILRNYLENGKLASLRYWFLPTLMNGQVTVGEAS